MKRIIVVFLAFVFIFCSCGRGDNLSPYVSETALKVTTDWETTTEKIKIENYISSPSVQVPDEQKEEKALFKAAWLSYAELSITRAGDSREEYIAYIDGIFDNMKEIGISDVFVHVRPFADAFYPSELFPTSAFACGVQGGELPFDILSLIIERAKIENLGVHAWINPYRISHGNDINELYEKHPARLMYETGAGEDVVVRDNGIYFNPASQKALKLIVDGARELLENYDIKGIHIDDYFYFEDCADFDFRQYKKYTNRGGTLSLENWRRENVSCLLSSLYSAVKGFGEDKIFSVSPSGDIAKCYNEGYADVYLWCREKGYCDMIIPQLYYGFENERLPFGRCLEDWSALCGGDGPVLVIGLALYKVGEEDVYALSGKNEWLERSDIIARQAALVKEKNCFGFALYSGTYINFSEKTFAEELNNLKTMV